MNNNFVTHTRYVILWAITSLNERILNARIVLEGHQVNNHMIKTIFLKD